MASCKQIAPLLTIEDVGEVFRCSDSTLRRIIDRGDLPYTRIPGCRRLLFRADDVQRILDQNRVDAAEWAS